MYRLYKVETHAVLCKSLLPPLAKEQQKGGDRPLMFRGVIDSSELHFNLGPYTCDSSVTGTTNLNIDKFVPDFFWHYSQVLLTQARTLLKSVFFLWCNFLFIHVGLRLLHHINNRSLYPRDVKRFSVKFVLWLDNHRDSNECVRLKLNVLSGTVTVAAPRGLCPA